MNELQITDDHNIEVKEEKNILTLHTRNDVSLTRSLDKVVNYVMASPSLKEVFDQKIMGKTNIEYRVKMTEEIKRCLGSGELNLMQSKDGTQYATVMTKNGSRIRNNLPIEQVDIANISSAMLNIGMQMQLAEIKKGIDELNKSVAEVLINFENDRLARAMAVKENFAQAKLFANVELKNKLILNIVNEATMTKHMLYKQLNMKVDKLLEKGGIFEKNKSKEAEEAIQNLYLFNEMFMIQLQCYAELKEYYAISHALEQYRLEVGESFNTEFQITVDEYFEQSDNPFSTFVGALLDNVSHAESYLLSNQSQIEDLEELLQLDNII